MNESADPNASDMPCPFCAGRIHFPTDEEGKHTFVLHTMPACKKYLDAADALAFVKLCNLEVAKKRGVGLA